MLQTGKRLQLKLKKELLRGRLMQQELQARKSVAPATLRLMLWLGGRKPQVFSAPKVLTTLQSGRGRSTRRLSMRNAITRLSLNFNAAVCWHQCP